MAISAGALLGCACRDSKPVVIAAGPAGERTTSSPASEGSAAHASGASSAANAPVQASVALTLMTEYAVEDQAVSLGVPFAPGELRDIERVSVRAPGGREVAAHVQELARWPQDDSLRSVLVVFPATLSAGRSDGWTVHYGTPNRGRAEALAPAPDGPVVAVLPPRWYARSRVLGLQQAAVDNREFPRWESTMERALLTMDPRWESYGLSCRGTSGERTYYDAPHTLYLRFIRHGGHERYRRARAEAVWYRDNELTWFADGQVAQYACASDWNPERPMSWRSLRNMLAQGMLADYLITGDPEAARALRGLGEAYLRNLPALSSGERPALVATERNLGWVLMGLASYYAIDPRPELASALDQLVERARRWQAAGTSGAFEHDLHIVDPDECDEGPRGGSPFMTSLLVDGLMDTWMLTGDKRIPGIVTRVAVWLRDRARLPSGAGFRYLWGCADREYGEDQWAELNLLIAHIFGASYHLTGDSAWLRFGDEMARQGMERLYAGRPKQWSQVTRGFSKYLGYRAAVTP
ncbi:hypothetical protein [Haliangium ochraceum]|uniref:D-glucuronyl C5-epimerase C-terminal domain-containing protein n=1 Tax=Haliangium ochraceum (strain DSM 14365 / JCM 11303 / SMP-2) TaxID=502025 RepID=D0LJP5_HALO1|nr:hypothetical protein [Haliangium ochraceum]ACY16619.1 conserved hypothetical protein [Haliangium ochraceum DSM 14365]